MLRIAVHLKSVLPGTVSFTQVQVMAEAVASGNAVSPGQGEELQLPAGSAEAVFHAALVQGFGWVMLYGGLGVWLLAGASYLVFGAKLRKAESVVPGCTAAVGCGGKD